MKRTLFLAAAATLLASTAIAQAPAAPAPAPQLPACGPNGFARPVYGTFGDNDGIVHPYEIVSACTPQAVKDAAEAIGMGRTQPLGIRNVTTTLFSASGSYALDGDAPVKIDKLNAQISYFLPAMRLTVTKGGAKPVTQISVFNDKTAWAEKQEGVFLAGPPPVTASLLPLYKLTPFGALWSVIEAEGNATVATVAGKTVISGASPYDGIPVTVTLGPTNLPIAATATIGGRVFSASYGAYTDKLEPKYLILFTSKITITADGKPYADLTTTEFKSNPYVVFPIPAEASKPAPAQTAAAADGVWTPPAKRVDPADAFFAQVQPTGDTPKLADGHPDLSGQWSGGFPSPAGPYGLRRRGTFEPDQFVMQKSSYRNKPVYKPEYWPKVRGLDFSKVDVDAVFRCFASGVPRQGAPQRIVATPKEMWTMNVAYSGASTRVVPTDGRKRPESDTDYAWSLGMPLGHWEGDTMVVDSVGFNDTTWLNWAGYFHTDQMTVTERLRRRGDLLFYQFTVHDPDVLAEPWTSETFVRKLAPDPTAVPDKVEECTENDLDAIVDLYERG